MAKLDLGLLPKPSAISQIGYEEIQQEMMKIGDLSNQNPSDPAFRVLLSGSYREMLLRQDADDQVRAVLLATTTGVMLDHLGVTYYRGIGGEPVVRLAGESDDAYRLRLHESPSGLSTAGPADAYEFHAKSAHPNIKQAKCTSPGIAQITIYLLGHDGDGVVTEDQCKVADAYLWNRRPLTDYVQVKPGEVVSYEVNAALFQFKNPDYQSVMAQAEQALRNYVKMQHRFKAKVTMSAIHAVLSVYGVTEVRLNGWADIVCSDTQAPYCSNINLAFAGWDDEAMSDAA